jgi:hypothetical protein
MRDELDKQLCEKYPKIFVNRHGNMRETAMCWGFEHGDGWYNIIDHLCNNIQNYIDWKNQKEEVVTQVVAEQVKEKFGTLRFYYSGGNEYIRGLVTMAESMSGVTCEECGTPGKQRGGGWIRTLCDEHAKGREIEDDEDE